KRIYRSRATGEEYMLYGARGEKLGVYWLQTTYTDTGSTNQLNNLSYNVWFGNKLIYESGQPYGYGGVFADRLGTNRQNGARYYPYGEEITSTPSDHVKFGTYFRDGLTGLDYADQRFYASAYGRFNSPDRYRGSA